MIGRGLFQDGLDRVLKTYSPDVEIVGVAETWEDAKPMLAELHPDALIADYACADVIVPEMESFTGSEKPLKAIFVILDENKMIVYQRQQMTDITIDRLIESL